MTKINILNENEKIDIKINEIQKIIETYTLEEPENKKIQIIFERFDKLKNRKVSFIISVEETISEIKNMIESVK